MIREFLRRKKKPKWTTPHKFMHKSRLINSKHMFQTQREKINNMGTNSYCTRQFTKIKENNGLHMYTIQI